MKRKEVETSLAENTRSEERKFVQRDNGHVETDGHGDLQTSLRARRRLEIVLDT